MQLLCSDNANNNEMIDAKRLVISNLSNTFQHMIDEIFERIGSIIISDFLLDLQEYKKLK